MRRMIVTCLLIALLAGPVLALQKNVASQKWVVFAFDRTDNTPKTGDAAQITANLRIDGAGADAIDDTNPTELEDGYYIFDLTQGETNGDLIVICPASSTGDIQVVGTPMSVWTIPANLKTACDNYSATRGLAGTALPDAVADAAGGLPVSDDGGLDLDTQLAHLDADVTSRSTLTAANVWETNISAYAGAGYAGTYLKNLYDNQGDWATAVGFSTHSAADVKTAVEAGGSHLALILADTGELQTNQGAWATAVGFSTHSAADVKTAIEAGGSHLALILEDTGTTIPGTITTIDGIVDDILVDTGTTLDGIVDAILLDTGTTLDGLIDSILATTVKLDDTLEDDGGTYRFTENALEEGPGGGAGVTVTDISQAALAKFVTEDSGETVASAGSVAKIAQGSAGGNVTVGDFTQAALAQFATDDTGETTAAEGSVAALSRDWGGGPTAFIYTVTRSDTGASIPDVRVWVTSDSAGLTVLAQQYTNAAGQVTFYLDAGTYYVWRAKAGFDFTNPDTETVE